MAKTAEGEMGDYPSDYTLAIPFDGCVSGEVFATDLFDGKGYQAELKFPYKSETTALFTVFAR